jgi:hypothetical protein
MEGVGVGRITATTNFNFLKKEDSFPISQNPNPWGEGDRLFVSSSIYTFLPSSLSQFIYSWLADVIV